MPRTCSVDWTLLGLGTKKEGVGGSGLPMKSCEQLLCLGLVLLLAGCATTESTEQAAAESVARAWLSLVDSGQYDKAYEQYAPRIRVGLSKERSIEWMRGRRAPLGSLLWRQLADAKLTHRLPRAPDGTYMIFHYHSSFTNKESASRRWS